MIRLGRKGLVLSQPVKIALVVIMLILIIIFIGQLTSRGNTYSQGFLNAIKNFFAGL